MKKLKGSTIVEAVVSALIITIVFGLTLTILAQIGSKKDGTDYFYAKSAFDSVMVEIRLSRKVVPQTISYPWGTVAISELKPTINRCYSLELKAFSVQGFPISSRSLIVDSTLKAYATY